MRLILKFKFNTCQVPFKDYKTSYNSLSTHKMPVVDNRWSREGQAGCHSRTRRISVKIGHVIHSILYMLIGKASIIKAENLLSYGIAQLNVGLTVLLLRNNRTPNCNDEVY